MYWTRYVLLSLPWSSFCSFCPSGCALFSLCTVFIVNKCCAYAITLDWRWNLNVRNYCDHLKLIMTTYSCYACWVETCRNLSGQELSNICSSGTQIFHLPMYLCDYSFLMMRWNHKWWNHKWGLGWKALSLYRTSSGKFCSFVMHSSSLSMALVSDSDIFGWQCIYSL